MFAYLRIVLTVACLFSLPCFATKDLSKIDGKLKPIIENAMKVWHVPGAAVAIVQNGKVVYIGTFGVKKAGKTEKIDKQTKFYLASVTKNFTAMVIAKLVDEGKLNWDDPIVKYIPEFKLNNADITKQFTIRDALGHRSGLTHFTADSMQYIGMKQAKIIEALALIPFKDRFRQDYGYQNVFIGIAGIVAERATGQSFGELVSKYYLRPLSLKNTCVAEKCFAKLELGFMDKMRSIFSKSEADNIVGLHFVKDNKPLLVPHNPNHFIFPGSSGILASVEDMAKWMIFRLNKAIHEGKSLVSEANLLEQEKPNIQMRQDQGEMQWPYKVTLNGRPQYGMGWFIHDWMRVRVLSHTGGIGGARALMYIMPEEGTGIIVMCNNGGMRTSLFPESVLYSFMDFYVDNPDKRNWTSHFRKKFDDRKKKASDSWKLMQIRNPRKMSDISKFAGKYQHKIYGELEVSVKDNKVFIKYGNMEPTRLSHINGDIFKISAHEFSISYTPDDIVGVRFYFGEDTAQLYIGFAFAEGEDPFFYKIKQ